jgi:hypothetical protein
MEGVMGNIWGFPVWLIGGIFLSFALAFLDLFLYALMLSFVIFFFVFLIVLSGSAVYGIFVMPTNSIAGFFKQFIPTGNIYTDFAFAGFVVIIIFLFSIPYIYRRRKRKQANAEARAEERINSWEAGKQNDTQNIVLEKGEIGRILNYWQQKFSSATTDEEKKTANEKNKGIY